MRVGRYFIESILSKNGMGEVYLANLRGEGGFKKQVVIKLAKPELSKNERLRKQFIREATLSAQLSHQNIVQVFDFGFDNERPYLVMEYMEGVNLRELLDYGVEFTQSMTASVISQVLSGLEEAFQKNIIHRDLSPSNILINKYGIVKIADFGLAKFENEPQTAEIWGKLSYIAPEIINGENADYKSDLYSLGKIGEELLKNRDPKLEEIVKSLLLSREDRASNPSLIIQSLKDIESNGISELSRIVISLLVKHDDIKPVEKTGRIVSGSKYLKLAATSLLFLALILSTGSVDRSVLARDERAFSILNLNVVPWAYVYIDDVFWGETPIIGKKVAAGSYKVVFTNPSLHRSKELKIELQAGKEESIFHSFSVSKKMNKSMNF